MMKFGMFNSINGDRRYKAEDFAQYFATFIGNGIFVKPSDCLQIRANGDSMSVIVRPGKAWVNGFYLINDEDYNLPLAVGDTTLNRIDRIVIRLDFIQRKMSVEVKKGTLSASPIAPTLKRDADAYELALADVYIAKGALTINQAAITDTRLNNNLCGLMHGVVDQVDTTTLFNQYQQWFDDYSVTKASEFLTWQTNVTSALEAWIDAQEQGFEAWRQAEEQLYYTWLNGKKNDFDAWFATIRGILDEEAAGNIINVINDHKESPVPHKYYDASDGQDYFYGLQRNSEINAPAMVYGLTEQGPHNFLNMSTYEQVENVKNEMISTGGKLAGVDGKMYKALMVDYLNFQTPYRTDKTKNLENSYATKFPEIAAKYLPINVHTGAKARLRDNLYFTTWNRIIIFMDMVTMDVIYAFDAEPYTSNFASFIGLNWFEDSKYYYMRGYYGTVGRWVVFDKNTLAFVKIINQVGAAQYTIQDSMSSQPVLLNNIIYQPVYTYNVVWMHRLSYDSFGVPIQSDWEGVQLNLSMPNVPPKAIWKDGPDIVVLFGNPTGTYTIEKWNYNTSTKTFNRTGFKTTSGVTAPSGICTWQADIIIENKRVLLFDFGSPGANNVFTFDSETLSPILILSGKSMSPPTMDYVKQKLYLQFYTPGDSGITYNGNPFERIVVIDLTTLKMTTLTKYVPMNLGSNGIVTRALYLQNMGFVIDDELYCRFNGEYGLALKDYKQLQGYEEIKE